MLISLELGKDDPGGGMEMVTRPLIAQEMGGGTWSRQGTVGDWYEKRVRKALGAGSVKHQGRGQLRRFLPTLSLTKPLTKKRLGGGTFASVTVVSSLLHLPILVLLPLSLRKIPVCAVENHSALCSGHTVIGL